MKSINEICWSCFPNFYFDDIVATILKFINIFDYGKTHDSTISNYSELASNRCFSKLERTNVYWLFSSRNISFQRD